MNGDNARAISILRTIRNIALDVGSSIGTTKESVIEAMGMAISSLDRPTPTPAPGALPELPEPIGHVHSDYEYCADKPFKNDGWPVSVFDEHQMHAYARAYAEQCRAGVVDLGESLKLALATIDDYLAYDHDGDPWKEDARAMGEMDINDFETDGRLQRCRAALQSAFADDEGVKRG